MFDRASKKLGLEQAVLGTFGDEEDDKITNKEMEQLLKKGAYALLEDENDEMGNEFCADDIDSILAKRTRTRVVEGPKTASWLNKAGMVVSKSKFSGEASGTTNVDIDDPDFWQKVMPDFVTPTIMLTKLDELSELLEGAPKRGPGRGRKKKQPEPQPKEDQSKDADEKGLDEPKSNDPDDALSETAGKAPAEADDDDEADEGEEEEKKSGYQLSRGNRRRVHKFMSDLKSMMEGILLDAEDDSLPQSEKSLCQKLLLTISIKERLFNEEQRKLARILLKRLEGDRRRRCRESMDQPDRVSLGNVAETADGATGVREELLILSKHQRKKRKQRERPIGEPATKRTKEEVGEDGYLRHSDSEADWSEVDDDIYKADKKKTGISKKEAKRRRAWATDEDAAVAAGRPWPALPRHLVNDILSELLDEMIKYDEAKDGIFSQPVPRDELPEYYEQIENPMDYGTMKAKLNNGEYRSAQAMQKDFALVMRNCNQFNAKGSDIVREASQQALMRPVLLRNAALKHGIFLAEDGSAVEVYSDGEGDKKGGSPKKKRKLKKKSTKEDESSKGDEEEGDEIAAKITRKSKKVCHFLFC